jgi:hypothetical protein
MLPSDQGRYRGRYTPSLHFALHPHCNGGQVVGNIGALHVTLQGVAVRCVTPPSIGGVTQQRNATVAEATGWVPSLALWVMIAPWLLVGAQQPGYLVQLGGCVIQAPALALASVPAPPPPPRQALKSLRPNPGARSGSAPAVGHTLTVCDQSVGIFSLLLFPGGVCGCFLGATLLRSLGCSSSGQGAGLLCIGGGR